MEKREAYSGFLPTLSANAVALLDKNMLLPMFELVPRQAMPLFHKLSRRRNLLFLAPIHFLKDSPVSIAFKRQVLMSRQVSMNIIGIF